MHALTETTARICIITCREKELPAIEVVSLWLAEVLMWLDNLFVALRHWSINEPKLVRAVETILVYHPYGKI